MKARMSLMEYVWLTVAFISAVMSVDAYFRYGFSRAKTFLIFVGISLLMYLWRRSIRKNDEKKQEQE